MKLFSRPCLPSICFYVVLQLDDVCASFQVVLIDVGSDMTKLQPLLFTCQVKVRILSVALGPAVREPERMSEYMPEGMSEYMLARMPERMSEYMPDRMPH